MQPDGVAPVKRKVAVKIIKAGMDSRHVIARGRPSVTRSLVAARLKSELWLRSQNLSVRIRVASGWKRPAGWMYSQER